MHLSMSGALGADYKSGSQRARVVTESWGEHNLYCPNCSSPKLARLAHNTHASDFSCPKCRFWFQLKGQKTQIGNSITDGAYEAMMRAIQRDESPSYYFMHYDLATWTVKNLLLVPHFAFPPSAIVKRPPLSATARRAGWVGCNFALNRIPADARIEIVRTVAGPLKKRRRRGHESLTEKTSQRFLTSSPTNETSQRFLTSSPTNETNQSQLTLAATIIASPEEVREKFRRIKPLKELSLNQRGWTLDVLNIVRSLMDSRRRGDESLTEKKNQSLLTSSPTNEFTNSDIYAFERELSALHPDNRHIRDKIRQQLQVLRDLNFLVHVGEGIWRVIF